MRHSVGLVLLAIAVFVSSCSDDGLCGDNAGESHVEVDATALAQPAAQLRICINDLCNEPSEAGVAINYRRGEHPSFAIYTVERRTGGNWEPIAGDRIDLSCGPTPFAVRVVINADGTASTAGISLSGG